MAVLLFVPENVNFLKRELRKVCLNIKSSHLSEAVAVALGYAKHASLIEHVKRQGDARPHLVKIDFSKLVARIKELGEPSQLSEGYLTEICRLPQMPRPMWREFPEREIGLINRWFRDCKNNDNFDIHIRTRRTRADLIWDHVSLKSPDDDHRIMTGGEAIVDRMFSAFQRKASSSVRPQFYGSALNGKITNLSMDDARDLADEFAMILSEALHR